MANDLGRRIQRQLDAFADGDSSADDFVRFAAKLRAQSDPQAVDSALSAVQAALTNAAQRDLIATALAAGGSTSPRQTNQSISGGQVGVAVAGDVLGNIYVNGTWAPDERKVVSAYLRQIVGTCHHLPLQGVHQQSTKTDVLNISLKRVYTEAATTKYVQREIIEPQHSKAFNASAFLQAHTGVRLLPRQLRTQVYERTPQDERSADTDEWRLFMVEMRGRSNSFDLGVADPDSLQQHAADHGIAFYGPQLATEAIANERQLVLLGEPGSGKSTVLRYLALTLAEAGLDAEVDPAERLLGWAALGDQQRPLPVFYPLLRFSRWLTEHPGASGTAEDLWSAIAESIDPGPSSTDLRGVVRKRLQSGELLLLLDGLDEVATNLARIMIVKAVRQFAEQWSQCRVVVTCRVRAYEGEQNIDWQLGGWPTATLADWNLAQMTAFMDAWYHEAAPRMEQERRQQRIEAMQQALAARLELQLIGRRPLLLTIMALVHLNDGHLPQDTPALLSRCIDILLAQWEDRRADGSEYGTLMEYIGLRELSVQNLRPLLESAAFMAHNAATPGSQGFLRRADLFDLVGRELKLLKHTEPWSGTERFLDYTDKRAGLLHANDAGDEYGFPLQTVQEYLAGRKLVSGVDPVPDMLTRRGDDRWYRPIMYGLGDQVASKSLNVPFRFFQKLLNAKDGTPERVQRDYLLAADLAEELGWERLIQGDDLFEDVRSVLASKLATVVDGAVLPAAERVRAGVFAGRLGDPSSGVCSLPPAMVNIPGGSFVIGYTPSELAALRPKLSNQQRAWFDNTANEQPVTVNPFALARYPVTNAQFKLFMDDRGYDTDAFWWDDGGRAWLLRDDQRTEGLMPWQERQRKDQPDLWDNPRFGSARPNHPVVGVSWYEAQAFCRWLAQHATYNPHGRTYRLPTEAEWEWAARGAARRTFPWGDEEPDGERANYNRTYNGTSAVGCFAPGATPEGVLDLAGTVWEWTGSVYAPYPYDPRDGREQPSAIEQKRFTLRGGSWGDGALYLRAVARNYGPPDYAFDNIGFRLATHLAV